MTSCFIRITGNSLLRNVKCTPLPVEQVSAHTSQREREGRREGEQQRGRERTWIFCLWRKQYIVSQIKSRTKSSKRNHFSPITQMNKLRPREVKKYIQRDTGEKKGVNWCNCDSNSQYKPFCVANQPQKSLPQPNILRNPILLVGISNSGSFWEVPSTLIPSEGRQLLLGVDTCLEHAMWFC